MRLGGKLCVGKTISEKELGTLPVPKAVGRHVPLGHSTTYEMVKSAVRTAGYSILDRTIGLTDSGDRMFAMMLVASDSMLTPKARKAKPLTRNPNSLEGDFGQIIALRSSYDKSMAQTLLAGSQVMVCSNLNFYAEHIVKALNTKNAATALDERLAPAMELVATSLAKQDAFINELKSIEIDDAYANDVMVRAAWDKHITWMDIPAVASAYYEPEHEAFEPRTSWSLFNAFTTAQTPLLRISPFKHVRRNIDMTSFFEKKFIEGTAEVVEV